MEPWGEILSVAVYMTAPLIVSGTLHMVIVRLDLFAFLKIPLHEPSFGANKTWRGFFVMPLLTAATTGMLGAVETPDVGIFAGIRGIWLGLALGIAYVAFELPNSYVKRRLGVAPGALPDHNRALFFVLDHVDSLTGCVLVYALTNPSAWQAALALYIVGPGIHTAINLVLFGLRVRKQPF